MLTASDSGIINSTSAERFSSTGYVEVKGRMARKLPLGENHASIVLLEYKLEIRGSG